jgi:hypothetical protein
MKRPSDEPIPEKLVALLYGELSEAEAEDLRARIAADPSLQEAWEALDRSHRLMMSSEDEEAPPRYVFVPTSGGPIGLPGRRVPGRGVNWRSALMLSGWGVAVAAVLVAVLSTRGPQLFPRGRELRPSVIPSGQASWPGVGFTPPSGSPVGPTTGFTTPTGSLMMPAGWGGTPSESYVTREELQAYTSDLSALMIELLDRYGQEQDRRMVQYLDVLYNHWNTMRGRDYQQLEGRLEAVRLGVLEGQRRTENSVDDLRWRVHQGLARPVDLAPNPE